MVELDIIIALATITYIVKSNVDELHPLDGQVFNGFINDKQIYLAKSILGIFFTLLYVHIHMIYMIYIFSTCVHI